MSKFLSIRYSLILLLLPLVVIVIILTSVFSVYEARSTITVLADRHMAFKSEELRDYAYSEWEALKSLELENNPELQAAAQKSIMFYSRSLLREKSEKIFIFDKDINLIWELSLLEDIKRGESVINTESHPFNTGWINFKSDGEERVGILFEFTPFGWYIILSDLKITFFSEIKNIERNSSVILIISIIAILILIPFSLGHVVRHVEDLSTTAFEITEYKDFSRRVEILSNDETGLLAERFNSMLDTLQKSNEELEQKSRAEKEAKEAAEEQEREALFLLSRISDIRDEDTGNHLKRIGVLSELMGQFLNLSPEELRILLHSAPLHDIGKIGISDSILLKPEKLTTAEFELIKTHTTIGYNLLKSSQSIFLREGAAIAFTHHEKWDGSGYPAGISGEEIPLMGRIVSIVDVLDALLSDRPYKRANSLEEACEFIMSERGRHFDPLLVDLLIENIDKFIALHTNANEVVTVD